MRRRLRGLGMRLWSDLPVPGAVPDTENVSPDVVVSVDFCSRNVGSTQPVDTRHDAIGEGGSTGPFRLEKDQLVFTMPGVAQYRIRRNATQIVVCPEPGVPEAELADYLQATALPALAWLRGEVVLHAAAAVLPGQERAIAFCGPSGAGKSTLLRRLLLADAAAVGDDALALRGGTAWGLPAATQDAGPPRISVPVPPRQQRLQAQLGCVLELCEDGPHTAERQPARQALAVLLRNLHRFRVARLLSLEPLILPQLAALAQNVPVYRLDRRRVSDAELGEIGSLLVCD